MQFLEKLWKNGRKYGDIKLIATNRSRDYLVSEPQYHTTKQLSEKLFTIKMKKKKKNKSKNE